MSSQELVKLENSLLVRQANGITESRHALSATEQNIMYMLISQIRDDDPVGKVYSIYLPELEKLTNRPIDYSHLKEASQKLIGKVFRVRINNEITEFAPLNFFMYKKRKAIIELKISDEIRPFFFALKNNYTRFQFQTVLKLKSKYSKRIYVMLKQFEKSPSKKLHISVRELKERLELIDPKTGKEKYEKFGLFATYVLEVAMTEINKKTEIRVKCITKKTGAEITHLEFEITSKEAIEGLAESTGVDSELAKKKIIEVELVSQYRVSKMLAKKVIQNISIEKIEAKNKMIWKDYKAGKIGDISAYCTTLFQNWLDGAEPMLEKPNSPKHIALKPIQTQDPDLEKENLTRLYGFGLEQKLVYALNVDYSSVQVKSAISKVDEALKKQEISSNPEQIFQALVQALNTQDTQVEYSHFSSIARSGSSAAIGEQLAQIVASSRPVQIQSNSLFEEEDEKLKQEKNKVWGELIINFNLSDEKADSLVEEYSLEDLKAAIIKVSEELKDQETPRESGHMIQLLKKQLKLA